MNEILKKKKPASVLSKHNLFLSLLPKPQTTAFTLDGMSHLQMGGEGMGSAWVWASTILFDKRDLECP